MAKRKPSQPVGGDIDWFVIPIEKLRQWGLITLLVLATAFLGYFIYTKSRRSPEEKARTEILSQRKRQFDPDVVDAFVAAEADLKTIRRELAAA